VQTLVELLVELKRLGAGRAPDKLERIAALFSDPRAPAELQVGRHYVVRMLAADVDEQLDSLDPARRKAAITAARLVFPRGDAARVLRRVYQDPDPAVRGLARRTVAKLGLEAVAPAGVRARGTGGSLQASWAFGIFPGDHAARPAPKQPGRPSALEAYQLPRLATAGDVARLVGIDEDQLAPLMRPGVGPGSGYVEFEIPKAKGGTRRIAAPRAPLRKVQRAILDQILARVPMHDACHGFVAGRSTVTNAAPHQRAAIVVKLDLKDFFPTVHYRRVLGLFQSLGYSARVAGTLAGLTTYRPRLDAGTVVWPGRLPQGAPTSPALANLACRRLDRRLARLAATYGATYTRYADDLTFSFPAVPDVRIGRFLWWVDGICQREGFLERPDKRRILRAKHQQRVTGIVVNAGVHVPRADRKRFRAILHNCKKHGVASQAKGRDDFEAYLAGYAAYVQMVEPALGRRWALEVEQLLGAGHG
jgi:RNA-directed DNA polymerase